jgi:hypothetical protein
MSIILNIADIELKTVKVIDKSKFLYTLYLELGEYYEVPIPEQYCVVINNYISFSNSGQQDDFYTVEGINLAFELYQYLDDDNYFEYLIRNLLKHWSSLSLVITNINLDLQDDIYLCLPLHLIPTNILLDNIFISNWMNKWRDNNQKSITVDTITYKIAFNEFKVQVISKDTVHLFTFDDQHHLLRYVTYDDKRMLQGLWRNWYPNKQLKEMGHYKNNLYDGLYRSWYEDNGALQLKCWYDKDARVGKLKQWYVTGQIEFDVNYFDGGGTPSRTVYTIL